MSEIQEIDVTVSPDGMVKLEVRGAQGKKCIELTEEVEKLLGGVVIDRIHTDEYEREEIEQEQAALLKQTDG